MSSHPPWSERESEKSGHCSFPEAGRVPVAKPVRLPWSPDTFVIVAEDAQPKARAGTRAAGGSTVYDAGGWTLSESITARPCGLCLHVSLSGGVSEDCTTAKCLLVQ